MSGTDRNALKVALCRHRDHGLQRHVDTSQLPYQAAPVGPELEHPTRKNLIDPLLRALGWDTGALSRDLVEEARIRSDTTLYLDYVGIKPQSRAPVLVVEAKASSRPPPHARLDAQVRDLSVHELIALALNHLKWPSQPQPLTQEWVEWLGQVRDYVDGLRRQGCPLPRKVVITSGVWMVIIAEPGAALIDSERTQPGHIIYFPDLPSMIANSDTIYEHLAQAKIVAEPPHVIEPHQTIHYAAADDIRRAVHGVWVKRVKSCPTPFAIPRIEVSPTIVLERRDAVYLRVVGRDTAVLPSSQPMLDDHIRQIGDSIRALRQGIESWIGAIPQSPTADQLNGFKLSNASNRLAWPFPDEADEFLIAVGVAGHFLQSTSSVADCPHHDWTTCHSDAHATPRAILTSSIQPAAFFPSGTAHHCASQIVHDSRRLRCHLAGFETHLCCRACALQSDCWTAEELRALPCGVLRTALPAAPAPTRKPRRKRTASVGRTVKSQ